MTRVVVTQRGYQSAEKLLESLSSPASSQPSSGPAGIQPSSDPAGSDKLVTIATHDKAVTITPYRFNQFTTPCILSAAANLARVSIK